jgi:hypothetical protein
MSILFSIKEILGIPEDDYFFDHTLIMHINTAFSVLRQIGCGPSEGYSIDGYDNDWSEFLQNETEKLQLVKTYVGLRVRQVFDPPANGTVQQAIDRQVQELEWRISTLCDPGGQP